MQKTLLCLAFAGKVKLLGIRRAAIKSKLRLLTLPNAKISQDVEVMPACVNIAMDMLQCL